MISVSLGANTREIPLRIDQNYRKNCFIQLQVPHFAKFCFVFYQFFFSQNTMHHTPDKLES